MTRSGSLLHNSYSDPSACFFIIRFSTLPYIIQFVTLSYIISSFTLSYITDLLLYHASSHPSSYTSFDTSPCHTSPYITSSHANRLIVRSSYIHPSPLSIILLSIIHFSSSHNLLIRLPVIIFVTCTSHACTRCCLI